MPEDVVSEAEADDSPLLLEDVLEEAEGLSAVAVLDESEPEPDSDSDPDPELDKPEDEDEDEELEVPDVDELDELEAVPLSVG